MKIIEQKPTSDIDLKQRYLGGLIALQAIKLKFNIMMKQLDTLINVSNEEVKSRLITRKEQLQVCLDDVECDIMWLSKLSK